MEEDVMSALRTRIVYLPGGYDRDGRVLIVLNINNDLQPWNKKCLEICINYIKKSISSKALNRGVTVILDAQKCPIRFSRAQTRILLALLGDHLANILLVRSEGFWDKRVDHCAKSPIKGEPIITTKARLHKYFEISELPVDLGGTLAYNHDLWLDNRARIDDFHLKYEKAINDLDNLHILLLDHKSMRPSETDQILESFTKIYSEVQSAVKRIIEIGNQLMGHITESYRLSSTSDNSNGGRTSNSSNDCGAISNADSCRVPQDLIGEQEKIEGLLNEIEKQQSNIRSAWHELERSIHEARELSVLEEGVSFVTNWILGTAETMLNRQQRVGCDVHSCEDLRRENELLELQCWETYGFYAELLHKIDMCTFNKESYAYKDLMSQKDFMDFVCRSFATRLERRRNILITSVRFYRLVSEYFDKTSEVFEALIMGNKVDDFDLAAVNLQKLKDSQQTLAERNPIDVDLFRGEIPCVTIKEFLLTADNVEKELIKEGEKLSDMLSMPVKDALGRDIGVDYSDDIANIRDILDATIARRNIFIDSVELQKLTLEQVTHIHAYEQDARIAIKWMDDLYSAMIKCHSHVGCNVHEIQLQKDELHTFQETGKSIYHYGCQLLEASLALRQSCKLVTQSNVEMSDSLRRTWNHFETVSQEHMTRLRVSAVFHRSVEEYCHKLNDLKANVTAIDDVEEPERQRSQLRKYLTLRERLLVEVGRMVRLGRLLKTRLKEPFSLDDKTNGISSTIDDNHTISPTGGNAIACDAITRKLTEVSDVAESLDSALRNTQNGLDLMETTSSSSEKKCDHNHSSSIDEWSSSVRSTEDESFVTASECACTSQSRSSSYQTASECRTSPWWNLDKTSIDTEASSENDQEPPSVALLTGILSSASASFDSSDQSFFSAKLSPQLAIFQRDAKDDGYRPFVPAKFDPNKQQDHQNTKSEETDKTDNETVNENGENEKQQVKVGDATKPEVRSCEIKQSAAWSNNYYQNIVAKQAIKGCL